MKTVNKLFISLTCVIAIACSDDSNDTAFSASPTTGKSGSMARFALGGNYLYVVDNLAINVFEIESGGGLKKVNRVEAGFGVETIFVKNQNLYIGANDAMYIYGITKPAEPKFIFRYSHIFSCDPVVVNGDYAYVTLRAGSNCRAVGSDVLEIINISDPMNPTLVQSYEVNTPYGLGIDGNILFLCQGNNGIKIYNVSNPNNIQQIASYESIHAYDVIPNNGVVIMTGNDGIFQYDYQDINNIHLLSHITVQTDI